MYKTLSPSMLTQEQQLFAFMCLKFRQYPNQIAYFEKTVQYFDILERSEHKEIQILHKMFKDLCGSVKGGIKSEMEAFKKQIDNKVEQIQAIQEKEGLAPETKQVLIDQGIDHYVTRFSMVPQKLSVIKKNLQEYNLVEVSNEDKLTKSQLKAEENKNMLVSEIHEIDLMLEEQHQEQQVKEESEENKPASEDNENPQDNFEDEMEQKQQLLQSNEHHTKNKKKTKAPKKQSDLTLNKLIKLNEGPQNKTELSEDQSLTQERLDLPQETKKIQKKKGRKGKR